METTIYFLFFVAIFCAPAQSLERNNIFWPNNSPVCDVKKDITDLKGFMLGVKKELNQMKIGLLKETSRKLSTCSPENDIADLKDFMASFKKELNDMKNEFIEEIKEMRKQKKEENLPEKVSTTPAMKPNGRKEENPTKKISTTPAMKSTNGRKEENPTNKVTTMKPNKCADAMYFRGGNTFEYARYIIPDDDEDSASGSGMPEAEGLSEMTTCFWIRTQKRNEAPNILSYAIPERDNEITIYLTPNVTLLLKTKAGISFYPQDLGIWVSDGVWHHVCITWENSRGTLLAYKDGELSNRRTGFKPGAPIAPSGMWIIGQDQDRFGGGFQLSNAFHGSLTEVNVWNRVLGASEISTLAAHCGSGMAGNYRAYKDFTPFGGIRKFAPECCA